LFRRFLDLFIYSNIFIAFCAVAMVYQCYQLVIRQPANTNLLCFVLFATLSSYSFHWYLTSHSEVASDRIEWTNHHRYVHTILFVVGAAGTAFYFFPLIQSWPWLILSAVITFLYSAPKIPQKYFRALRQVAVGKTVFLAFVWMYATTILPVIISGKHWTPDVIFYILSRFFLVYAICILFDYRDRKDDKAAGIRSMITYFSETGVDRLFFISLSVYAASSLMLLRYDYSMKSVYFLLIPGGVTGLVYKSGKRRLDDLFFYFLLDGLMMLSSLLMIIFGI
jgi:4-hydroxybenzoate polyprenyltransferase